MGTTPIVAGCGTEIPQAVTTSGSTSSFPTIQYKGAGVNSLYTVIIVDQDAGTLGPIAHTVVANVPGSVLKSTIGLNAVNVQTYFLEPYNGPGVSAGMGCHRYNVIIYLQTPGMAPYINMSTAYNYLGKLYLLNFNFPVFASQYGLTRVATQMWQTQAAADRAKNGPCVAPVCTIFVWLGLQINSQHIFSGSSVLFFFIRSTRRQRGRQAKYFHPNLTARLQR